MVNQFFDLESPHLLQWLWLLVPLAGLFAFDLRRRQRVLQLFVSRSLLDDVSPGRSVTRSVFKFAVLAIGLAVLVLAAARPRWDPREIELEQRGQNILFCIDVSNSMRAADVDPSRLDAAKQAIRSMVADLPAGHQVGLLAYAGDSELKCPLTPNYSYFLSALPRVTYNSVSIGGSNLGDAIFKATREVFGLKPKAAEPDGTSDQQAQPAAGQTVMADEQADEEEEEHANVMIILTDGESHEGHAREMAAQAHALGVGIYIIGIGTKEGARIPIEEKGQTTYLRFKGQDVITTFEEDALQQIVAGLPSRAGFLAAGASHIDLMDGYTRVIAKQGTRAKQVRYTLWQEKFQIFVGIGLALIILASFISEQRPTRQEASG